MAARTNDADEWRRPDTGSQPALQHDPGSSLVSPIDLEQRLADRAARDAVDLERRLAAQAAEREAKRESDKREARMNVVRFAAVVFGLAVALVTTAISVVGWWTQRVRADVEREAAEVLRQAEQQQLDARLNSVEQAVTDVERVLELGRVERGYEQSMMRMILEGQGQTPPERPADVQRAADEIGQILAK